MNEQSSALETALNNSWKTASCGSVEDCLISGKYERHNSATMQKGDNASTEDPALLLDELLFSDEAPSCNMLHRYHRNAAAIKAQLGRFRHRHGTLIGLINRPY